LAEGKGKSVEGRVNLIQCKLENERISLKACEKVLWGGEGRGPGQKKKRLQMVITKDS